MGGTSEQQHDLPSPLPKLPLDMSKSHDQEHHNSGVYVYAQQGTGKPCKNLCWRKSKLAMQQVPLKLMLVPENSWMGQVSGFDGRGLQCQ